MRLERSFRWAEPSDYRALADVMFDAVRNGPSHYSEGQRQAWVPEPRSGPEWTSRLAAQDIVVAESDARMVGFMSLAAGGYIDFAYIRPEAQRTGLFRQLLDRIVKRANEREHDRLWVHASLMARPAFEALGFSVKKEEEVAIGSERFERFEMERPL
jgi:putative acetyltransferase